MKRPILNILFSYYEELSDTLLKVINCVTFKPNTLNCAATAIKNASTKQITIKLHILISLKIGKKF